MGIFDKVFQLAEPCPPGCGCLSGSWYHRRAWKLLSCNGTAFSSLGLHWFFYHFQPWVRGHFNPAAPASEKVKHSACGIAVNISAWLELVEKNISKVVLGWLCFAATSLKTNKILKIIKSNIKEWPGKVFAVTKLAVSEAASKALRAAAWTLFSRYPTWSTSSTSGVPSIGRIWTC